MSQSDLKPCPLCGSDEIHLTWSGGGVGGQMMAVSAFASCENCHTTFRDVASSTAGFTLRECKRLWDELPERLEWMRRANAERKNPQQGDGT